MFLLLYNVYFIVLFIIIK